MPVLLGENISLCAIIRRYIVFPPKYNYLQQWVGAKSISTWLTLAECAVMDAMAVGYPCMQQVT